MIKIARLTLNAFGVNTYLLMAENGDTIIVDAGCSNSQEQAQLTGYIQKNNLKPTLAINTHAHIDHICGVNFVKSNYGIKWGVAAADTTVLSLALNSAQLYGFDMSEVPTADFALEDGAEITLGEEIIKVIATPGHSAGGVCFYIPSAEVLITGDTLFHGSIGRTDLPTGDYNVLMNSIVTKLLPLGDELQILPGHGESSQIGEERNRNPFVTEYLCGTTDSIQEQ